MWRLAPCLDAMWAGAPQDVALREVAAAGREFEFWDWRERDIAALQTQARVLGLQAVAFSGTTFAEPLLDPALHEGALAQLRESLRMAAQLGTRLLVVHVGYTMSHRTRAEQWQAAVAGLRRAGDLAGAAGVTVLVEPLNSLVDHPNYFLDTLPDALAMLAEADHPAVRLLLDVYHMWVMHGDALDIASALPVTAHVHVADVPGRGEPGSGTVPWPTVTQALREGGYAGVIGLECWPTRSARAAVQRSGQVLAS